jgi:hypothetical protein
MCVALTVLPNATNPDVNATPYPNWPLPVPNTAETLACIALYRAAVIISPTAISNSYLLNF